MKTAEELKNKLKNRLKNDLLSSLRVNVGDGYAPDYEYLQDSDYDLIATEIMECLDVEQYAKEQRIKFGVFVCKSVNTERISDGDELKIIEELDEQFINQKKK